MNKKVVMTNDILNTLGALGIDFNGIPAIQTNANESMHTTNTNAGAELVPSAVLAKEVFDAIPQYGTFLQLLPGFHGVGMGKSEEVPVIGDVGFFNRHTEDTDGAFALAAGNKKLATDKVTINQYQLDMTIDVTNELSTFNTLGAEAFTSKLKEKIARAMVRTVEAAILNGDTTSGSTGNVNTDDAAPASTSYYLNYTGLRRVALTGTGTSVDVGTFAFSDLIDVANCLGDYFSTPEDCLWIFNRATYNKALTLDEFANAAKNGKDSTIFKGALTNILGADVVAHRDMAKTEADGKVNTASPSSTLLGQFLLVWKPGIQYGYGQELQLQLFNMGKDGYQLQGWFMLGFAIVQKKAGVTDSVVGLGYNVTL